MVDKLAKNWHIITLAFGLIVSLWMHFNIVSINRFFAVCNHLELAQDK
ncbi:MAG: hypothetical protein OXE52_16310 [Chloroflexi bacterium]|nr:hypothetical protein [Chloroflexota bacterium]